MEIIYIVLILILITKLAMLRSMNFSKTAVSDHELINQMHAGSQAAKHEHLRRPLLPTLKVVATLTNILAIVLLFVFTNLLLGFWIGALASVAALILVEVIASQRLLDSIAATIEHKLEPLTYKFLRKAHKYLKFMETKSDKHIVHLNSVGEFREVIDNLSLLSEEEKSRINNMLDLDKLKVKNHMVSLEEIIPVSIDETIGPLLLDKLHHSGHKSFPVIRGDIDHIKGMLYMSDIELAPPDVESVKDVMRPSVLYVDIDAKLTDVLSANLQSGRQQFIVIDDKGKTKGLITVKDVVESLIGKVDVDREVIVDPRQRK